MSRPITITAIQSTSMNDDPYITVVCTTDEGVARTLHLVPQAAFILADALDKWVNPEGELHAEFRHMMAKSWKKEL